MHEHHTVQLLLLLLSADAGAVDLPLLLLLLLRADAVACSRLLPQNDGHWPFMILLKKYGLTCRWPADAVACSYPLLD